MKRITLFNAQQGYEAYKGLWLTIKAHLMANRRVEVSIEAETRDTEQNKQQWPILQAFAKQIQWPVNGSMVYMSDEEWKDVLTAAFKQETVRLAMGLNGGVVMLGLRTSKIKRQDWPEWMAFLKATAAMRGVRIPLSRREAESMGFTAPEYEEA